MMLSSIVFFLSTKFTVYYIEIIQTCIFITYLILSSKENQVLFNVSKILIIQLSQSEIVLRRSNAALTKWFEEHCQNVIKSVHADEFMDLVKNDLNKFCFNSVVLMFKSYKIYIQFVKLLISLSIEKNNYEFVNR